MVAAQSSIESSVIELSQEALTAFAEDISTMFEVEIACSQTEVGLRKTSDIQKAFKKLSTFHTVQADGALSGRYLVGFDCGGLFTLGGVIVMLPPNRVKESVKRGTLDDAEAMGDAVGEVGNLLIGAWDRVFREELDGHRHFRKEKTFIGNPWDQTESALGLTATEEFHYIQYKMTVGDFTPFTCGVIFPMGLFAGEETPKPAEPEPEAPIERPDTELLQEEEDVDETPVAEAAPETIDSVPEPEAVADESAESPEEEAPPPPPAPEPKPAARPAAPQAAIPPEEVDEKTVAPRDIPRPKSVTPRPRVMASNEGLADILSLPVKDAMDPRVVWGGPNESVQEILSRMQQHDVGYAMIGEEGVLQGIVSKSNILGAISPYLRPVFARWHTPADDATLNIKIQWVMTRPVRTVGPVTTLGVAIGTMQHFGGRCLPVVDERGEVLGILTVFDILRVFSRNDQFGTSGRTPQAPCLMI